MEHFRTIKLSKSFFLNPFPLFSSLDSPSSPLSARGSPATQHCHWEWEGGEEAAYKRPCSALRW